MPITHTKAPRIAGIVSAVPPNRVDNLTAAVAFEKEEVEKVVRLAGVKSRHVADDQTCSSDLCFAAAKRLLQKLNWSPDSIDGLVFVTQTPDYFLPSTSCLMHERLGLRDTCAAFDVGLGCSGYAYGLWLASMMLQGSGFNRVLLLHGETPTRFADKSDRAVGLLFGDAGSATALEAPAAAQADRKWWFCLQTDGSGWQDLIIEGGGFRDRFPADRKKHLVSMNGANVFNFTIKRVPPLVIDTMNAAGLTTEQVDYFVFHQSNQFIIKYLLKKARLPETKVPLTIGDYGSAGGPSVPLTLTCGGVHRPEDRPLTLLLIAYGVGLSWGSALVDLAPDAVLDHVLLGACRT